MAYDKIVTADTFILLLQEMQGIWQNGNRGYDAWVKPGATSVRRPKVSKVPVTKNGSGVGYDNTGVSRTNAKANTTMVETSLDLYTASFFDEVAAAFESNAVLRQQLLSGAAVSINEKFDIDFLAAVLSTTNLFETKESGVFSWEDVAALMGKMTGKKMPRQNRIIVFDADLEADFLSIDVIKNALSFNNGLLTSADFTRFMNYRFYVSANMAKVDGQPACAAFWGPGVASILSKQGVVKEVYDSTNKGDIIDVHAHAAFELDDNDFAVVYSRKA